MPLNSLPQRLEVTALPVYVESWSVARIPGFILAVLERWQRNHGALPARFAILMCPQAELNACGGLPKKVIEHHRCQIALRAFYRVPQALFRGDLHR